MKNFPFFGTSGRARLDLYDEKNLMALGMNFKN